uniref:BAR domain-containing protein n=1 Tax=Panagrellus redivivus TaxID=6233 RepID=A0A7E4W5K7_PANRE
MSSFGRSLGGLIEKHRILTQLNNKTPPCRSTSQTPSKPRSPFLRGLEAVEINSRKSVKRLTLKWDQFEFRRKSDLLEQAANVLARKLAEKRPKEEPDAMHSKDDHDEHGPKQNNKKEHIIRRRTNETVMLEPPINEPRNFSSSDGTESGSPKSKKTKRNSKKAKAEREAAQNELEARVCDIQDRLTNEHFTEYASSTEVEKLSGLVSAAATWLEDAVDASTKTEDFKDKKSDIDMIVGAVEKRQTDFEEHPTLVKRSNASLTKLDELINKMKEEHKEILPEDAFIKPVEVLEETRVFITEKDEELDRVADVFVKFTCKFKDIEKAAKAAAAEAANAAAAAVNAIAAEFEPNAETDDEPKTETNSEPNGNSEHTAEIEAKTETDQTE